MKFNLEPKFSILHMNGIKKAYENKTKTYDTFFSKNSEVENCFAKSVRRPSLSCETRPARARPTVALFVPFSKIASVYKSEARPSISQVYNLVDISFSSVASTNYVPRW